MSYLKKIEIKNFLGIANYEHEFAEKVNFIQSKSGSGKSTIATADCWIKNLNVPFEPKINGKKIIGLETSVKETYVKNDIEYTFEKTAKPLYKAKQGEEIKVFDKYDYKYFFNDCALKNADYEKKLVDFFETADHEELQIISLNGFFNNDNGNQWNKSSRQQYLFKIFDIDNKVENILNEYDLIINDIKKDKLSEEQIKANLLRLEKGIKEKQAKNNTLIESKMKEKGELQKIDFTTLMVEKETLLAEIATMQSEKIDTQIAEEISKKHLELSSLKNQVADIEREYQEKLRTYTLDLNGLKCEREKLENEKKICEQKLERLNGEIEDIEIELSDTESETFNKKKTFCPTCKQELPQAEKDCLIKHFKEEKAKHIADLRSKTEKATIERQNTTVRANTLSENIVATVAKETALMTNVPQSSNVQTLQNNINILEVEITQLREKSKDNLIAETINKKQKEYDMVTETLGKQKTVERLQNEIMTLKTENKTLSNQDGERLRKLLQFNEYKKRKNELLNTAINDSFDGISFNFVEQQGGGSQFGEKETCECMWGEKNESKRVYSNLSGGEKVLADFLLNYNLRKIRNLNFPQFTDEVSQRNPTNMSKTEKEFLVNKTDWQTIYILTDDTKKIETVLIEDLYDEKDCDTSLIQ